MEIVQIPEAGSAVTARRHHDLLDLRWYGVEVETDPVLVAVSRGGLAEQLDAAVAGDRVVVEAEVGVAAYLAVAVQQQHGDVGVALPVGLLHPRLIITDPTSSLSAASPTFAPLTIFCMRPPDALPGRSARAAE